MRSVCCLVICRSAATSLPPHRENRARRGPRAARLLKIGTYLLGPSLELPALDEVDAPESHGKCHQKDSGAGVALKKHPDDLVVLNLEYAGQ